MISDKAKIHFINTVSNILGIGGIQDMHIFEAINWRMSENKGRWLIFWSVFIFLCREEQFLLRKVWLLIQVMEQFTWGGQVDMTENTKQRLRLIRPAAREKKQAMIFLLTTSRHLVHTIKPHNRWSRRALAVHGKAIQQLPPIQNHFYILSITWLYTLNPNNWVSSQTISG